MPGCARVAPARSHEVSGVLTPRAKIPEALGGTARAGRGYARVRAELAELKRKYGVPDSLTEYLGLSDAQKTALAGK